MYKPLCRECFNEETAIKEIRESSRKFATETSENNMSASSNDTSKENSPAKNVE
jgi:hypothetical protein